MHNLLTWLQQWYKSECNGDWEHEYGIKIETVDNPGWFVSIDLSETKYQERKFLPIKIEKTEQDWYFCLVKNNVFTASCSSCNLEVVLKIFRDWIEQK